MLCTHVQPEFVVNNVVFSHNPDEDDIACPLPWQPVLQTLRTTHLSAPHQMIHLTIDHVFEPYVVNAGGYQSLHCQVLAHDVFGNRVNLKRVFPDASPQSWARAKAWTSQFHKGDNITVIGFIFRPVTPV